MMDDLWTKERNSQAAQTRQRKAKMNEWAAANGRNWRAKSIRTRYSGAFAIDIGRQPTPDERIELTELYQFGCVLGEENRRAIERKIEAFQKGIDA